MVGALALVAAGCGGDDGGGGAEGSEDVTGSLSIMAIWGGDEQASFQAVIDGFTELYPNVTVKYTSGGDNLAPLLSTAVEGGNPPDIAAIGQPGLMADFAEQDAIQPIDDLRETIVDAFGESVADVGAIDGTQYGVMFKGANKSLVWYNVADFEEAGVEPPETWEDLQETASTIKAAGITPWSVGVDVGWPISDLFENVYIRTAGRRDVRPAHASRDPVDGPVREGRARADGRHRRRVGQPRRRHRGVAADGDAGVRREGVLRGPGGGDGHDRRLRTRRDRDDAGAGNRLQRLRCSPRSRAPSLRSSARATSSSSSGTAPPQTRSSST